MPAEFVDDQDIYNAACEHLLSLSPRPPIVWENLAYDGSKRVLLMVEDIPSQFQRVSHGGTHRFAGKFQISVVVPRFSGVDEALTLARRIQQHYYNARFAGVFVRHYPSRIKGYDDGSSYRLPVQVRYESFSQPASS